MDTVTSPKMGVFVVHTCCRLGGIDAGSNTTVVKHSNPLKSSAPGGVGGYCGYGEDGGIDGGEWFISERDIYIIIDIITRNIILT